MTLMMGDLCGCCCCCWRCDLCAGVGVLGWGEEEQEEDEVDAKFGECGAISVAR